MPSKRVTIGEMDRRIVIEQVTHVADSQGGTTETWSTFATVWAKVETRSRLEKFFADKINPTGVHQITIRWLDGVDESMRVVETISTYLTRTFHIRGIDWADEKRFQLVLHCEENVQT